MNIDFLLVCGVTFSTVCLLLYDHLTLLIFYVGSVPVWMFLVATVRRNYWSVGDTHFSQKFAFHLLGEYACTRVSSWARFFLLFFSSSIAVFFIAKPSSIVLFVVQTKWTFNHEGRGHRSLIGVSCGIGRPHRDTLGFSEYKIPYARCWDQFVRYQIACDLPHRAERDPNTSLPTVRLPTWLDKWSLASPDARSRTPCPLPRRPSPKRTPSSSWKGLKY